MRCLLAVVLFLTIGGWAHAENLVLLNGVIVDGTGKPQVAGNLRIRDGKIVDIGNFQPAAGETTIDLQGLVVAPGFIDIHNHSAVGLGAKPEATSQIMQGITTVVLGADGDGPVDVDKFLETFRDNHPAVNVLTFVGHNNVRRQVMGADYKRAAKPDEIGRMADLVFKAMSEGAVGLSSGLDHDAGIYAKFDELLTLARTMAKSGGVYMTSMRDDADNVIASVQESINIGRLAKVPVEIGHLRLTSASVWGQTPQVLAELDKAHAEGIDVTADVYPYDSWPMDLAKIVRNGKTTDANEVVHAIADIGGANNILFIREARHPDYAYQTLLDLSKKQKISPSVLFGRILREGGAQIMCSSISDRDIRGFISSRWVMIGSDGGLDTSHPRSAGTFPYVLGQLVGVEKLASLAVAIAKMTGVPATRLGIKDRGILKKGAIADITIFDVESIHDKSTFQDPFALAEGVKYVFVNGQMVVKDGQPTDEKPGLPLKP